MTPDLASSSTGATRTQILAGLGSDDLSTESLLDSWALPPDQLALIRDLAVPEDWGNEDVVLLRYLAAHVPPAIEQGRYVWNGKQIVMRAGHLATAAGAAIYLGLARIDGDRWELSWARERPSTVAPLLPPDLGTWPELDPRREVVVVLDQFRAHELAGLPLVMQNAAVAGAVEWSLRRGLAVRQLRGESRGYFVPVHLTNRNGSLEIVAPIQVQADRLVVRALIEPRVAYTTARAVAERREELPRWLLDAWEQGRAPGA